MKNIHPIFEKILKREHKERLLGQKGMVIWLTGLSGAGKSTIAAGLERSLYKAGYLTFMLDGDNIRKGLSEDLSFRVEDRAENTRRVAEVAKLFLHCGIITICSFVSPTRKMRHSVRDIIGSKYFHEIFVDTPLEVCEKRDVKGLYAKARKGEIKDFTGIDSPFERPLRPRLTIKTAEMGIREGIALLRDYVLSKEPAKKKT
jgi:adenylylsulfate kinase